MPTAVIENRINRIVLRRKYLQSVTWQPEDSAFEDELYDFQDYVAALLNFWDASCRLNDYILEAEMTPGVDYSRYFRIATGCMKVFRSLSTDLVQRVLPNFEAHFGDVKFSAELRQAADEASTLLADMSEESLAATRTPVNQWE